MNNFLGDGNVQTVTAPANVSSGDVFQVGGMVYVATADALSGADVECLIKGKFTVAKTTGQAWTRSALVYWDAETETFTTVAGDNHLAGTVAAAALSAAATGEVYLDGVARPDETT